mgnify:CR=1 FL=1
MGLLNFKGSWRDYQKRILDNLDFHLSDKKLHIVAAPGAGKTTLGIEVISRINKPTVILVPTNTIKNQWRERICNAFLEEKDFNIVSTNIRNTKFITIITYQALLAAFCGGKCDEDLNIEEEIEEDQISTNKRFNESKAQEIIKILKDSKISLLCFDEAHHLRKEWWKALTYLVEELNPEQTLALTATPPYDVDLGEWQRYEELCGEIDEVISIPELVNNGDLCPHQDFIYFSGLKKHEKEIIKKHNENVKQLLERLKNDNELINYLKNMEFFKFPQSEVESIFEDPEFYISIISFLKFQGVKIPSKFLKLFDAKESELPKFDLKQAKIFLNGFLFLHSEVFAGLEEKIDEYTKLAKHLGLIHNRRIAFTDSVKIERQISSSLGKLDSIVEIVDLESKSLGKDLRMVVLADFIKADDTENNSLGVVPIWRTLKNKFTEDKISLGVLCGSLILLPKNQYKNFESILKNYNLAKDCVSIGDFEGFIKIVPKETCKNSIVSIITKMFNNGDLTVLVGTQALLGEGWDAPCINSLILSSTVSSYMLSNQMRGRAIRIDKNNPDKISNIWHLASFVVIKKSIWENIFGSESETDNEYQDQAQWHDINTLSKRFEGFEAPSYFDKHEIMNGISRVFNLTNFSLLMTLNKNPESALESQNSSVLKIASDRQQTKKWWDEALNLGYNQGEMRLTKGVDAEKLTMRTLCYKSYREQVISALITFVIILSQIPIKLWWILFLILFVVLFVIFLRFLKTGTVSGVMKQIAIVILETMDYHGYIKTSLKKCGLTVDKQLDSIYVSCKNLSEEENNLFIKSLQEFFDPIENPRYILVKKDKFAGIVSQIDYFSIPSVFCANKKSINVFKALWEKYIGNCEIVYTRNLEGRRLLLKARKEAFSSSKRKKSKRLSKWQ